MILSAMGRCTGKEQEQLEEANQDLREDSYLLTAVVLVFLSSVVSCD